MFRKRDFFKRKSKQPDFSLINQSVVSDLYVSAIIYPRNEYVTGYVVFVGINNEGETVKCAGNAPGISPGEHVRVNGVWQIHSSPDFGDEIQICFSEIISLELETEAEIARYLEKMNVPGCGKQTVKKIIAKYGLSTLKVITEHPDAFAEEKIFGVNQAVLRNICAAVTRKIKSRAAYNSLLKKVFPRRKAFFSPKNTATGSKKSMKMIAIFLRWIMKKSPSRRLTVFYCARGNTGSTAMSGWQPASNTP